MLPRAFLHCSRNHSRHSSSTLRGASAHAPPTASGTVTVTTTTTTTGARRFVSKKQVRLRGFPTRWTIASVGEPAPPLPPHEVARTQRVFQGTPARLITSTATPEELPDWSIPEIAFAGRSNVGKSSLINALVSQPRLVRTSKTPGRTQLLNFFSLGGKVGSLPEAALVDMPGYGFANVPKRVADEFHALVGGYIEARRGSANLQSVFLLIDGRRGITRVDEDFMDFLHDLGALYQVVFTKADALSPAELTKNIEHAKDIACGVDRFNMHPIIHVTSTKESMGIAELQHQIASLAGLLRSP